ncbi:ABC transporter ATP-binding protein [Candidatus Saccharibacteria bacterium]|nr:ABC transporter ATP-binding protein [Candidatus Saccharibacteria bacterium]
MAIETNVVVAKEVSVVFDGKFKALDGVNVSIPRGQVVGFIGPSGAGKTTLIRCIVGRQKLTKGELTVIDLPAGSASLRARLSYMTQENSVYPDLTVRQNLQYFATMFGIKRRDQKAALAQLLDVVDMTPQADQIVSSLSGGQKQRVSLAVALIGKPELMVLDEPTVGLDPVLRDQIWELFRRLADEGTSLIISSHVMDEAERCDSLVLVREGRVLAQGSPKELSQQTNAKSVEQAFLRLVKGQQR